MASFSKNFSSSNNKWDVTIKWSASPGDTSVCVTWTVNQNDYGRTFALRKQGSSTNINSGSYLDVGSSYRLAVFRNGAFSEETSNFTIDAPYSVSYNANGGSGAPSSQEKKPGENLTLSSNKPTWTGRDFQNWNTAQNGGGTSYNPGGTYSQNSNVTLYAQWKLKTYSVTFDANGGSGAPAYQTKTYGTDLTLSSSKPSRNGYTFVKWNTASDGSGTDYNPGGTYTVNAALTLYAIWSINTWTVSYDANGGSGAPENQTKTYNKTLTLSSTKPTLTGYIFKEWNTSSDGTGTSYSAGGSYTGNAALKLYAIWTANQYTIKFNANGGSGSMSNQSMTYNKAANLTAVGFTWTGRTFLGWATTSSGSVEYQDKESVSNLVSTAGGSITLYAVWSINTIRITFDAATNEGSTPEAYRDIEYGSSLGTMPVATKQYYVFVGWFTSPSGGTQVTTTRTFTANTTLYAQFIVDSSVIAKVAGVWKKGIPYVKVNGVWKKGYAWVKVNGVWKQGIG